MSPFNISEMTRPRFTKPELLLHPQIPAGLAGLNPRSVLGQEWWDMTRKAAEVENNYCCHACGKHKSDTPELYLDGHERYELDYSKRCATYVGTVSLCRHCHSFIHIGRKLALLTERVEKGEMFLDTVEHGWAVLKKAGLLPLRSQYLIIHEAILAVCAADTPRLQRILRDMADSAEGRTFGGDMPARSNWVNEWTLVVDDKTYTRGHIPGV